jgi:hypothetical protein
MRQSQHGTLDKAVFSDFVSGGMQVAEKQAQKDHPEDETVWFIRQISGLLFPSTTLSGGMKDDWIKQKDTFQAFRSGRSRSWCRAFRSGAGSGRRRKISVPQIPGISARGIF